MITFYTLTKDQTTPPSIIKHIPKSINTRINNNSSNKFIFEENKNNYNEALKKSGFNYKLKYFEKEEKKKNKKTRHRNIIWFNPPFSKRSNINIGRVFLKLLDRCFPKDHLLHSICNRNCIKISYSCSKNIGNIINAHNKKIISMHKNKNVKVNNKNCSCRDPSTCPLDKKCLEKNVVYKATVTSVEDKNSEKFYIGISSTEFKNRYNIHTSSFKNKKSRNHTMLSKHVWFLKNNHETPLIKWEIIKRANQPTNMYNKCNLCISEKIAILKFEQYKDLLNKRDELTSKCRHRRQFELIP